MRLEKEGLFLWPNQTILHVFLLDILTQQVVVLNINGNVKSESI